jgi:hypothetical protein
MNDDSLDILYDAYTRYINRYHERGTTLSYGELENFYRKNQKVMAIKAMRDASATAVAPTLPTMFGRHAECLAEALHAWETPRKNAMGLKETKDWVDAFWEVYQNLGYQQTNW